LVAADDVLAVIFPTYVGAVTAVRILCVVAVLRAVSFVVPPLLDGMGRPDRTFTYTLCAAIVLPSSYVAFAALLGPRLGYESVAIAWAVGYPLAFAVLAWLAVYTLDWSFREYLKSVRGIAACMAAAGVVGWGVRWGLAGQLPAIRLVLVAIAVAGVTGLLLAYTQGISLRSAMRSMRGEQP
jgi:O-antigen/teichoic acid export membrane protein